MQSMKKRILWKILIRENQIEKDSSYNCLMKCRKKIWLLKKNWMYSHLSWKFKKKRNQIKFKDRLIIEFNLNQIKLKKKVYR